MSEKAKESIKKRLSVMSKDNLKRLKTAILKEKERREKKTKK